MTPKRGAGLANLRVAGRSWEGAVIFGSRRILAGLAAGAALLSAAAGLAGCSSAGGETPGPAPGGGGPDRARTAPSGPRASTPPPGASQGPARAPRGLAHRPALPRRRA